MTIDFDHLQSYTGDDPELVAEVLQMFSEQTALWMRALDPAADDATWAGVAHALKGSAQTVGAGALGELCARAEELVGGGELHARREFIAGEIADALAQLNLVVQRWQYGREMDKLRA